jgi:hypothetical protein
VEEEREGGGGEDGSEGVALLEDSGEGSATFGGESFKGECGADAPFAAHGDAEECAEYEEHAERGGEGAGEFDDGKAEDVEHQDGATAVAVGEDAEEECAYGAEGLGEKDGAEDVGRLGVEVGGDGFDAEDEEEEVETVEGPAEEGGDEGVPLRRAKSPEIVDKGHEPEDNRPSHMD